MTGWAGLAGRQCDNERTNNERTNNERRKATKEGNEGRKEGRKLTKVRCSLFVVRSCIHPREATVCLLFVRLFVCSFVCLFVCSLVVASSLLWCLVFCRRRCRDGKLLLLAACCLLLAARCWVWGVCHYAHFRNSPLTISATPPLFPFRTPCPRPATCPPPAHLAQCPFLPVACCSACLRGMAGQPPTRCTALALALN